MNFDPKYILTFDLEEWWSVHSFSNYLGKNQEINFDDRILDNVEKILNILDQYKAKATFFVLGRVAEKYPEAVRKIIEEGHEIGSHGYDHKLIYDQTPLEFEKDLKTSIKVLELITGTSINKFRAPSYSVIRRNLWALEIMLKNGIKIDSSIVPSENKRFGISNSPSVPYFIEFRDSDARLLEVPPTTFSFLGKRYPLSSGLLFRLNPLWLIRHVINKNAMIGIPSMVIIHNWELDLFQPRLRVGHKANFIHYYGLQKAELKLKDLLSYYNFSAIGNITNPGRIVPIENLMK